MDAVEDLVNDYIINLDVFLDNGKIGLTGQSEFKAFKEAPVAMHTAEPDTADFLRELQQYIDPDDQLVINVVDKNEGESTRYIVMNGIVKKWDSDGTSHDLMD